MHLVLIRTPSGTDRLAIPSTQKNMLSSFAGLSGGMHNTTGSAVENRLLELSREEESMLMNLKVGILLGFPGQTENEVSFLFLFHFQFIFNFISFLIVSFFSFFLFFFFW